MMTVIVIASIVIGSSVRLDNSRKGAVIIMVVAIVVIAVVLTMVVTVFMVAVVLMRVMPMLWMTTVVVCLRSL